MSILSFIWDLHQDDKMSEQYERIKQLEARVDILEQWIVYLDKRITDEQEQKREPV